MTNRDRVLAESGFLTEVRDYVLYIYVYTIQYKSNYESRILYARFEDTLKIYSENFHSSS